MHPNPAFRTEAAAQNLAFARARGFGTLCLNGPEAPMLSHVPFVLNDDGTEAELHLVRSNPIARAVTEATPAVLAVIGPDGYVSPDWYDTPDQVPTWNYVAVHLRGHLSLADPDTLRAHLDTVSAAFEGRLPKTPWTTDKMSEGVMDRMMRQILPFRFTVAEVHGTWKLNQNKTRAARLGAADAIAASPVGQETAALSDLMRNGGPPEMDKPRTLT
jgi:transcriptional regulator